MVTALADSLTEVACLATHSCSPMRPPYLIVASSKPVPTPVDPPVTNTSPRESTVMDVGVSLLFPGPDRRQIMLPKSLDLYACHI